MPEPVPPRPWLLLGALQDRIVTNGAGMIKNVDEHIAKEAARAALRAATAQTPPDPGADTPDEEIVVSGAPDTAPQEDAE